jgi:hypothetical protein
MILAADKSLHAMLGTEEVSQRWVEHPTSSLLHHDKACCEEARLWFMSLARSMEGWSAAQFELKAPTWLSQEFEWGPSIWPMSWCELVKQKTIDCGVFAVLAREIFRAQGHEAHAGQCLLRYNETCCNHWKDLWKNGMPKVDGKKPGEVFNWVGHNVVYHEVVIIELPDQTAKVYDSTFNQWYEPEGRSGFAGLLAVRSEGPRLLRWGNKTLSCGEWVDL